MLGMALMMISTVVSLRGLASQATYGYTSIFWYVFSAVLFLIPFSLVCAELASTFTGSGGVYRWCREAFGPRWGWAAIYFEWMMVVMWFPSVLMFAAVSLAYIFPGGDSDAALASNKLYTIVVVLAVYWLCTLNCFRGVRNAARLSKIGTLTGTVVPGVLLILLGIWYIVSGGENMIPSGRPFFPDFSEYGTVVLAASIFLFWGGVEMQAVHVNSMRCPQREFPRAIMIAVGVILGVFILGTLAIAFVMPKGDFNILQSLLQAYNSLGGYVGLPWLGSFMALLITLGVVGQVSVIIAGPATGILAVGREGYLPRGLQRVNGRDIPVRIQLVQGGIVTVLSFVLVLLPSVQSAYQIMSQMATVMYLFMTILVYLAFLRLRRTRGDVKRGFRIGGGVWGKWAVAVVGIAGAMAAMVVSFFPPEQISVGSPVRYVLMLVGGTVVISLVPFVVFKGRR